MEKSRLEIEMARTRPTPDEADTLLVAQRDYIVLGNMAIRCPRCGKPLEYKCEESGTAVYCTDDTFIITYVRGT